VQYILIISQKQYGFYTKGTDYASKLAGYAKNVHKKINVLRYNRSSLKEDEVCYENGD